MGSPADQGAPRDLPCTILVVGAPGCGKTRLISHLCRHTDPARGPRFYQLEIGDHKRTCFAFTFGHRKIHGQRYRLRAGFVEAPPPSRGEIFRKMLEKAHGIMFVVDSAVEGANASVDAQVELLTCLEEWGLAHQEVQAVTFYNKQDLKPCVSLSRLRGLMNRASWREYSGSAATGEGVAKAAKAVLVSVSKLLLQAVEERGYPPRMQLGHRRDRRLGKRDPAPPVAGGEERLGPLPPTPSGVETLTHSPAAPVGDETLTHSPAAPVGGETLTGGAAGGPADAVREAGREVGSVGDLWKVGDTVAEKYEITAELGRGGMGRVFKVHHREWDIDMAVKIPLPHLVADAQSRARFIREAETWVGLGMHPNIVQCYYVCELDGLLAVFADYVADGSLKDWIKRGSVVHGDWRRILDLSIQACDGLGYAHEAGVVHRDVKPANILMADDSRLCVTDFGIAKIAGAAEIRGEGVAGGAQVSGQHTLTITGADLGTPEYAAPEQWGEARHADARADIYALGVVMFELCCGRRPFDDGTHREDPRAVIGRHLFMPPPDPRQLNSDLPASLSELVLECLAKDPTRRPRSMRALRERLVAAHEVIAGGPCRRPIPERVELQASSLNNRAASLQDLGKHEEARIVLNDALKRDPRHLEAIANHSRLEWQAASITDREVLDRLQGLETMYRDRADYWCIVAEIQICRGACDEAMRAIARAEKIEPTVPAAKHLLARARQAKEAGSGWTRSVRVFGKEVEGRAAIDYRPEGSASKKVALSRVVAITPDGMRALTGSANGRLRVWDPTGACVREIHAHERGGVTAVAIDDIGRVALTGSVDETVCLWNLDSGERLQRFQPEPMMVGNHRVRNGVFAVAFHPNGCHAVSGTELNQLRFWNLSNGKQVGILVSGGDRGGRNHNINSVAFTPDGRGVLTAGGDSRLYLWDLSTGMPRVFEGRHDEGSVYSVATSRDGTIAISGGSDRTLRVWDVATGECTRIIRGHAGEVRSVALSADGELAVSASTDETVRVWRVSSGQCLRTLEDHGGEVHSIRVTPCGRMAVSGAREEASARLWHISPHAPVLPTFLSRVDTALDVSLRRRDVRSLAQKARTELAEGRHAVALEALRKARETPGFERDDELIGLWRELSAHATRAGLKGTWLRSSRFADPWGLGRSLYAVISIRLLANGRQAIALHEAERAPGCTAVWELATGQIARRDGQQQCTKQLGGTCMEITPDGAVVAIGADNGDVILRDVASGDVIRELNPGIWKDKPLYGAISALALSPDGKKALVGTNRGNVGLWELETGELLHKHTAAALRAPFACAFAMTPDGRLVVSGDSKGGVELRNVATDKKIRTFAGHEARVRAVAIDAQGLHALSGGDDHIIKVWRLADGEHRRTLKGHEAPVLCICCSRDGRFALSGGADNTVRIWDVQTGDCEGVLAEHNDDVRSVAITPDGHLVLTGSNDGMVRLWELDWELCVTSVAESGATGETAES